MIGGPTTGRHRPVRSYVLREGRITAGQERALSRLWPRFGVEVLPGERLDMAQLFGNRHPTVLEIGFGDGEALAAAAVQHPDVNFLGVEVHRPGVGHLLLKLEEADLDNLRVARHDAVDLLSEHLAAASLDRVQLYFPDPWPKKKHHKRRIVQPFFADLLYRALVPGGIFHAATDWADYAEHMLHVLNADPRFENTAGPGQSANRPASRPPTKFEQRGRRQGHAVWDLVYRRS